MFEQTILACKVIEPRKCVQHLAALTTREETRMAASQPTTITENWKPVVGFEGLYEVSDCGSVCRVPCVVTAGDGSARAYPKRRALRLIKNFKGYLKASLCKGGRHAMRMVHRLVLEAFVGPCPLGMETCHRNCDPSDNRLENLRWDTRAANAADSVALGRGQIGEAHRKARLTAAQVRDIRAQLAEGGNQYEIAETYGVTQANVSCIKLGKSWRRLSHE